ncbi:unnamed protein product [Mytilus coruscus]|uniref:Tyr recombinase domain-containing protein n=1 Tax=Mytilus coruscus TaxID=42192 RepID=A0A6J8EZJ5_MYTCO|nr:unnamed protein product [Mytilus coruscus]
MIMRAVKRIKGEHNPKPRLPITLQVLGRICNSLRAGVFSTFTDCMLETACTVAFFGFLRCGEFTVSKHFDSTVNLSVTDVEILDSYAIVHLKTSKTDPFRKGVSIQLHKSDHPFSVVQKYIAIRKGREASFCFSDPLFVKENGSALDRDFSIRSLRHVLVIFVGTTQAYTMVILLELVPVHRQDLLIFKIIYQNSWSVDIRQLLSLYSYLQGHDSKSTEVFDIV